MIRNTKILKKFERELIRKRKPDYFENLRVFESLYKEAMHLGIFPLKDPLEGIEVDIKLARALNVRRPPRKKSRRP